MTPTARRQLAQLVPLAEARGFAQAVAVLRELSAERPSFVITTGDGRDEWIIGWAHRPAVIHSRLMGLWDLYAAVEDRPMGSADNANSRRNGIRRAIECIRPHCPDLAELLDVSVTVTQAGTVVFNPAADAPPVNE